MVVDLKANEVVIKAGNSNQLKGEKKIPGKLIITNQRIYFRTIEDQEKDLNIELLPEQILEVIYFNTKKIFPYGLNVVTKAGDNHRFVVKKRNEFGQLINKMY